MWAIRTQRNLLRAGQAPPIETLRPLLLNDLVQLPDGSILVLDDYHATETPAVHQALAFLLDHLPPQLHLLDRLLNVAEATRRMDSVLAILIIRTLALQAQGDLHAALTPLERALTLAAPEGYARVFRERGVADGAQGQDVRAYVQQLLAVFHVEGIDMQADVQPATTDTRARTPDGELLTERELEVLRLLATGRSNQAIAQELVVAVGAVTRHLNNTFGKLGVQIRLEAAARARALG